MFSTLRVSGHVRAGSSPAAVWLTRCSPVHLPARPWSAVGAAGTGHRVETCTIATGEPNAVMAPLHNRMPVILDPADYDTWLDPTQPDAEALLRPCSDDWLEVVPVSTGVNNVRNEGPDLIVPLGAEPN